MNGPRRAALALHGLHASDRDWILAQLAAPERAPLDPLLEELRELGIPADRSMIDAAVTAAPAPISPPPAQTPRDRIRAASPARIREALAGEPAAVVASLIAVEPWPWRAAFLARLPHRTRGEISRASPQAARRCAGNRFADTLVDALDARLLPGEAPSAFALWTERVTRSAKALKPWKRK
jgi:hypothetical protein